MPRIYEQPKAAFSNFDHFKEIAVKTLNEIFGRVRPLDVIDFSEDAENYKAVGYYDDEQIPEEQAPGELQSDDAAEQERLAREQDEANKAKAEQEFNDRVAYVRGELEANRPLPDEDLAFAVSNGLLPDLAVNAKQAQDLTNVPKDELEGLIGEQDEDDVPAEQIDQGGVNTEAPTYTLDTVLKASDAAMKLAEEKGVDLAKVVGTGAGGNVTKADVENFLKTNAPVTENAHANNDQQQDA